MIKKIISVIVLFMLCQSTYAALQAIQNTSTYNFVLTKVTLKNATCNSCSVSSMLSPQGVQQFSFSASTGSVSFDYDVKSQDKYVGHIQLLATPSALKVTNGLGTTVRSGVSAYLVNYTPVTPLWKSQFTSLSNWKSNNWVISSLPSWGFQNIEVKAGSPKGNNYLRITYPAGSANYGSAPPVGGAQFYGSMINTANAVTLSFYVRFPTNFPFIGKSRPYTVGKLPGLYGGKGNTGTNAPTGYDGWSTRFMWCDVTPTDQKLAGGGELLQFTYKSDTGVQGTKYGTFLNCGSWKFKADGLWHNIQQTIVLNDVGQSNGRIDVCYDKVPIFSQSGITFRLTSSLITNGILFQTFFGGSGSEYATPINTYADFADFEVYSYPKDAAPGLCVTNLP